MRTPEDWGGEIRAAKLAIVALGLAAAVKLFIHARGTDPTVSQTGGWQDLDFNQPTGNNKGVI